MINATTPLPTNSFQFHDGSKEVMRITSDGITVPPDVTVDEAAKAVIEALEVHIKHVVAKRDAVLRLALEELRELGYYAHCDPDPGLIKAIQEIL